MVGNVLGKSREVIHLGAMTQVTHIHIFDPDAIRRGRVARAMFSAGFHVEIYDHLEEFSEASLHYGLVMVHDDDETGAAAVVLNRLTRLGIWMPVVAYSETVAPPRVVQVVRLGALNYLSFPFDEDALMGTVKAALVEGEHRTVALSARAEAKKRMSGLTKREIEVLDGLADGLSSKQIAQNLSLSSRTIEIHRMKLKLKLGANAVGDAIKLYLLAQAA